MNNFILKFGKYKGQDLFSTPSDYRDWLVKQKFVARQEDFDNLKEGDKIVFNYRYMRFAHEKEYSYDAIECTFIKQLDKHIVVSYSSDLDGETLKHKYLKSTVASIEVIK
jgi:hypothetical protein